MRTSLLLLAIIAVAVASADFDKDSMELVAVQLATRHGARSPLFPLPIPDKKLEPWKCDNHMVTWKANDQHPLSWEHPLFVVKYDALDNVIHGNCKLAQLTTQGGDMHLKLGQRLRQRYIVDLGLLPKKIDPSIMYLRSTDIDRTKQSLENQMMGLYPDAGRVPLNLHSVDLAHETIFLPDGVCPRRNVLEDQITSSPAWISFYQMMAPAKYEMCRAWGVTQRDCTMPWIHIFDNVVTRQAHDMQLPPGISKVNAQKSIDAATFDWGSKIANGELASLYVGELVQTIADNFVSVSKRQTDLKWWSFSGHDATVGPMVQILNDNAIPFVWPPYASAVVYELWSHPTHGFFVRMEYNGELIRAPRCDKMEYCPLERFIEDVVKPYSPPDKAWQCSHPTETKWPYV